MPAKGWKCLFFRSSVHHVQSGWGSFGFPPARNPFQIQSGVAAMTPLVAPKDCNRRPQIWVTQLSRCARLMYREPWQCNPRPWRHRWKSWRRRWWDGISAGQGCHSLSRVDSAAILLSHLLFFFFPPLHINKTVVLLKGQVDEARLAGSLVLDSVNSGQDGGKFLLFLSLAVYSEND